MAKRIEFKFDNALDYQQKAIAATVNLFNGQQKELGDIIYRGQVKHIRKLDEGDVIRNRFDLTENTLLKNLNSVQASAGNLLIDSSLAKIEGIHNFTVEMETGTGKTYVYLRTILELYQAYNFTKFLIVVPTLAIRKGVEKAIDQLREHFKALYGGLDIGKHAFVYDSSNKGRLDTFVESRDLQIAIMNTQAFNKELNIIRKEDERGKVYWNLLQYTKPIIIVDEPQKIEGNDKRLSSSMEALLELNPLFILRYSATHKRLYNQIYKLDSYQAFSEGLVKGIEVTTVYSEVPRDYPYIAYTGMTADFKARIELFCNEPGLGVRRRYFSVSKTHGDLYELSGSLPQYKGMHIMEDPHKQRGLVIGAGDKHFILKEGQNNYDIDEIGLIRIQIRLTIQNQLKRQLAILDEDYKIKVLTLFFIDRVDKFRGNGIYARIFDEEYAKVIQDENYNEVFIKYPELFPGYKDVKNVREGYFAQDKKGKEVDIEAKDWITTKTPDEVERGISLILERKDELISFEEPLAFLFSHSALREGWDNPNVFQICTLKHGSSEIAKKQEIGRGLRLPVDINGNRLKLEENNVLTVVANDYYENFARALQKDFNDEMGFNPEIVELSDAQAILKEAGIPAQKITVELAQTFINELVAEGIINKKTGQLDKEKAKGINYIEFGDETLKEHQTKIIEAFKSTLHNKGSKRIPVSDTEQIPEPNDKCRYMSEQKFVQLYNELCERVLQRSYYQVKIDSEAFIRDCIDTLNSSIYVDNMRRTATVTKGGLTIDAIKKMQVSEAEEQYEVHYLDEALPMRPDFELVNYIMHHTMLPRKALYRILTGMEHKNALYQQDVLDGAVQMILERLTEHKKKKIEYEILDGYVFEEKDVFAIEAIRDSKYFKTNEANHRAMTKYIRYDSDGEMKFAKALDDDPDVLLYTKLKRGGLVINTPYGDYTPDWAIIYKQNEETVKLYFIIETKCDKTEATLQGVELAKVQCAKKHFSKVGSDIIFDWANSYMRFKEIVDAAKQDY